MSSTLCHLHSDARQFLLHHVLHSIPRQQSLSRRALQLLVHLERPSLAAGTALNRSTQC